MDGWIIHHVLRSLHLASSWLQSRLGGFWAQDPKVHADSQTPWIHCLGSETDWLHRWMPEYVCVYLFKYIYIYIYMYKCLSMCTHIYIYIHWYIYIYWYTSSPFAVTGNRTEPNRGHPVMGKSMQIHYTWAIFNSYICLPDGTRCNLMCLCDLMQSSRTEAQKKTWYFSASWWWLWVYFRCVANICFGVWFPQGIST